LIEIDANQRLLVGAARMPIPTLMLARPVHGARNAPKN
jgi:hypothetical protein